MSVKDPVNLTNPSLTDRFRKSSRSLHDASEQLVYAKLLVAFTDGRLYAQAIARFWFVLSEVEKQLREQKHVKELAPLAALLPEFERAPGFQQDLAYYLGPTWREQVQPAPAVQAYLAHVREVARDSPWLLLVHSYTQHMGLAFGGQIVSRLVRRSFKLPDEKGTAAFQYKLPVKQVRTTYCALVNELGATFTDTQIAQLMEERHRVFQHNNAIMSSFHVGYLSSLRAVWSFCPKALLLVALVACAAVLYRKGL